MFEDRPESEDGMQFDPAASDRGVLYRIWTALDVGDLPTVEGWMELSARYPNEPRFRLFAVWGSLAEHAPDSLARAIDRILADGPALREAVIDLLSIARADHPVPEFETLAARFDGARRDRVEASRRLSALERTVLEECHDRTLGDRPLETQKPREIAGARDYERVLRDAGEKPEKTWSPTVVLHPGERVRHSVFGLGVVVSVREKKADILFPGGKKTLACRMPGH